MKKLFLILAILILAAPAFAGYRGTGTWTINPANTAQSSFIGKLADGTESEHCITPAGTTPNCVVEMPNGFNGGSYWIRTYNSVGQTTNSTPVPFNVSAPDPASGVIMNWQYFAP